MRARTGLVTGFLAALLLGPARAETVFLRDGRMLEARVVELRDDEAVLEYEAEGSKVRAGFSRETIDPRSFYLMFRERIGPGDGAAHLRLARISLEEGLLFVARLEAERARSLDEALDAEAGNLLEAIERRMAERLLERSRARLGAGGIEEAREEVSRLITSFPESAASEEGRSLLAEIEKERLRREAAAHEERLRRLAEKRAREREEILRPVREPHLMGMDLDRRGLETRSCSRARDLFRAAVGACRRALAALEEVKERHGGDQQVGAILGGLEKEIRQHGVQSTINLSSAYVQRGSYPDALKVVGEGLAFDPGNKALLRQRAHVELVQAEAGVWGLWRRGLARRR